MEFGYHADIRVAAGARNFEFTTRFRDDEPDGTPSDTLPIKVSVDLIIVLAKAPVRRQSLSIT